MINLEIIAYSGAISADYKNGPNYEEDCYSQWTHTEYKRKILQENIGKEVKDFLRFELSGDLKKDYIESDGEVIIITTLVNDLNLRPSFSDYRNWITGTGEVWVKDSSVEIYINDELYSVEDIDTLLHENNEENLA